MGNVSGRSDGDGTSGVHRVEDGDEPSMEFAQSGSNVYEESIAHSSQFCPWEFQPGHNLVHQRTDNGIAQPEKETPVMITWSHGGEKVAITGSWNNWGTIESMQRTGKEFIIMKVLPSGIYHYRFVVDGLLRCAPDFPCDFNDPGGAYNILDVKDSIAEAPESILDFEAPPSPDESYNSVFLSDGDFSKPPPELPPQIKRTPLNDSSFKDSYNQSLSRPQHAVLNHLYMNNLDSSQAIALGSTHRFLEKYVTVILYKPSWKHR